MPSVVRRDPNKQGLVLLSSNVSVADDGFVSIAARWLAPASGLSSGDFQLDSPWPAPLPIGLPPLQGGPYLAARNFGKQNGLTVIDTTYVSAVFPLRLIKSAASSKASFSGYAEDSEGRSGSISFDYYTVTRSFSYATVGFVQIQKPVSRPYGIFNLRREGSFQLVGYRATQTLTATRETVGRVNRFVVTANSIYEQIDPNDRTQTGDVVLDSTDLVATDGVLI
jgi:hypothetical protein